MEASLRNRLTYGPLMLAGVLGLLIVDHYAETRWTVGLIGKAHPTEGVAGIGLLAMLLIILPQATIELATLFSAVKVRPYKLLVAIGAGAMSVHAFLTQWPRFQNIAASTLAFIIVFVMIFAALRRALAQQTQEAIHHMAGTVLAVLYLGGLGWFMMALRVKHSDNPTHFHGTTMTVVMIILVVKFTDIGAYFGGRAFGRHKLIPWLSPGKTWEGLFCGMLLAGFIGIACAPFVPPLQWWKGFIFGVLIGGIGQVGDLMESLMKRDAAVKDSGTLIPGFGGVLDVIDSPLFASPFAYLMFSLFQAHIT